MNSDFLECEGLHIMGKCTGYRYSGRGYSVDYFDCATCKNNGREQCNTMCFLIDHVNTIWQIASQLWQICLSQEYSHWLYWK